MDPQPNSIDDGQTVKTIKIAKDFHTDSTEHKDSKFVKFLIKEKGLATIPTTAFYSDEHKNIGENFIRFCFFKVTK